MMTRLPACVANVRDSANGNSKTTDDAAVSGEVQNTSHRADLRRGGHTRAFRELAIGHHIGAVAAEATDGGRDLTPVPLAFTLPAASKNARARGSIE
jgi:hypothetical protein